MVQVLGELKKGFQKRRYLCAMLICALVTLSGYVYFYIGNPAARQFTMVFLCLSTAAMIYQWGNFFSKILILQVKTRVGKAKRPITWIDIPEFGKLAMAMKVKLHKRQPFGIMDSLDNAFTEPNTRQIVFGKSLFDRLEKMERRALAAHELAHLKYNHLVKQFFIPLVVSFFMPLTIPENPYLIRAPLYLAIFFMLFAFIGRRNEYAADNTAVAQTNSEVVISLLRKFAPQDQWSSETEVHPSIDNRIARLSTKRQHLPRK